MTGGGGGDHNDCVGYTMYHPVGTQMAMPWAESLEQLHVPSFIGTEVNAQYTTDVSMTNTIQDDVDVDTTTPSNTGGDDDSSSSSTITNIPENNIRYDHHNGQDGESTFSTATARTTGNHCDYVSNNNN
jgi:hypothetical protein